MSNESIVHDRVGVRGQPVPVMEDTFKDIPDEFDDDLVIVKESAVELENARYELGRLMQIVNHLISVCNTSEKNVSDAKKRIIEGMGLPEGNYAIDFEKKQVGLIEPIQKKTPRVV